MVFEPCGNITWNDDEYAALKLLYIKDEFYTEITAFLQTFNFEPVVLENLMAYQKAVLREPLVEKTTIALDYDMQTYFDTVYAGTAAPLIKQATVLR